MASFNSPVVADALFRVGESWVQDNKDGFLHTKFPQVNANGRTGGKSGVVTFNLPVLDQFMLKTGDMAAWNNGQVKRAARGLESLPGQFDVFQRDIIPISRDLRLSPSSDEVYEDLKSNIIPGQLSLLFQGLDAELSVNLTSTAIHGATVGFTNGGSALDVAADYANQQPDIDIQNTLQPMRIFQKNSSRFKIVCVIGLHVADILSRHPVYTGAGTGSAIASKIDLPVFLERFKQIHRLDEVLVDYQITDTVRRGQASALKLQVNTTLGFYVVDARATAFDATNANSTLIPDGMVAVGMGGKPTVRQNSDERLLVTYFDAESTHGIYSPRKAVADPNAANMSAIMTPTGAGGIFTTAP